MYLLRRGDISRQLKTYLQLSSVPSPARESEHCSMLPGLPELRGEWGLM